jgi:hypothetical protein
MRDQKLEDRRMVGHVGPGGHGLHAKVRGQRPQPSRKCLRHPVAAWDMWGRPGLACKASAARTWLHGTCGVGLALHARRAPPRRACLRAWGLAPPGSVGLRRQGNFPFLFFCFPSILERDPSRLGLEFVFIVSFCYFPNRCVFYAAVVNSSSTL